MVVLGGHNSVTLALTDSGRTPSHVYLVDHTSSAMMVAHLRGERVAAVADRAQQPQLAHGD